MYGKKGFYINHFNCALWLYKEKQPAIAIIGTLINLNRRR
jgi:hypothetical protein